MSYASDVIRASRHRRFRWRGGVGVAVLGPAAIGAIFSTPIVAAGSLAHALTQVLGWIAFAAGASLRFWATLYIGGRKERDLVTGGPYSMCRHPLYVGSFLLGVSAGFYLESWLFILAVCIVAGVYAFATIPVEESILQARHGAQYDEYRRTVSRLFPRPAAVRTPSQILVDLPRLRLECARAARWMWLPAVGTMLTFLRAHPWWPRLFSGL